jgi:hypothetical protein
MEQYVGMDASLKKTSLCVLRGGPNGHEHLARQVKSTLQATGGWSSQKERMGQPSGLEIVTRVGGIL